MKVLEQSPRNVALLRQAVAKFELDLEGISVLTEAASGAFVCTPLLAAMAGASEVVAVGRGTRHGSFQQVEAHLMGWAQHLGLADRLKVVEGAPAPWASSASLVTNCGMLRPLEASWLAQLPPDAAIPLMWEVWEFRPGELDLPACTRLGIPVLGTNEQDPRLRIFRYVAWLAAKLLLERGLEINQNRILVLAGGVFGGEIEALLIAGGAEVLRLTPREGWAVGQEELRWLRTCDAVVAAEHHHEGPLVGPGSPLPWSAFPSLPLWIHISGALDAQGLAQAGMPKWPPQEVPPRVMTVTTDAVGPKPVVELHAAGLKVGEAMVRGKRHFAQPAEAVRYALQHSPAQDWPSPQFA